ncbi:hypothetical protein MTO96_025183 [Rhipicephalus appendiculatus]
MAGRPARRVPSDCNRAAPALSNLRGRVSYVKEGKATVSSWTLKRVRRSSRADTKRCECNLKTPMPTLRSTTPPPVPASGPEKAEKEIVNQVGTICSVDENGGTLRFGAENEECAVFDRRCVPNTLLKPTEKVSEIFSVGNKVGFNARLTNTGAGAAQWQATMVTTVLRGNTSQVFVFAADIARCARRDSKNQIGDKLIYVPFENDPRTTFQSSQRCPSNISSASPRSQFPSESRTLVTAASFLPRPSRTDKSNASLVSNSSVAPFAPIVSRAGRGNGPMTVGPRRILSTASRTLPAESYLPGSTGTSNTSPAFDDNVAPGKCTPPVTQIRSQNGASAVRLHGRLSTESCTAAVASSFPGPVRSNTSQAADTSVAATTSAPTITQNGTGNSASAVRTGPQFFTESRTLSAASFAPCPAKNEDSSSSPAFHTYTAPRTSVPVAPQISSQNGASAVRLHGRLTTESRTAAVASSFPGPVRSNTSQASDSGVAATTSAAIITQDSTENSASAVRTGPRLFTESCTLSAASFAPCPAKTEGSNSSPAFHTYTAPKTSVPVPTQSISENGASAVRTRCELTTEICTLFPASNQSDHAKAEGNISSLVYDTNAAPRTSAPAVVIASNTAATESPDDGDGLVPQRCKPRRAIDISRSTTRAHPAAPAGGHSIPAGAEQPPKTTFEKTPRQCFPGVTNSHGTDSTAVRRQAPRSAGQPPTTAGDHRRPSAAVSVKQATRHRCGAGEDEQELAEVIAERVMSSLRSVIREEVQALRHEFLGHTGITAGAGNMSSGHHGSSSNVPKVFIQPRKTPLQVVEGGDVATGLPN